MQLEHFYGPGCSNSNFITAMIEKMNSNISSIDLTSGEQKRDFIFIKEVLNAYEVIIHNIGDLNETFLNIHIGTGTLYTIKEVLLLIKSLTRSETKLNFGAIPFRENELMASNIGSSKIFDLGWESKITLQEGLTMTINLKL